MVRFVAFDKFYFDKSEKWLSDPLIKRLTLTPDIDEENRNRWFSGLNGRKDYLIWGLEVDELPAGAVGIKHIDYSAGIGEYWGYIGEKKLIGMGIGKYMMREMIARAVSLGLNELYLNVAEYNVRARKLYESYGFYETARKFEDGYQLITMRNRCLQRYTDSSEQSAVVSDDACSWKQLDVL